MARLAAAALAVSVAVAGATGCGGPHPRPAALRVERADLVQLAQTLQQLQTPTTAEVKAARAAWPSLASGLPHEATPALRAAVAAAETHAAALTLPAALITEGSLTGPAAQLAGMLKSYVRLSQRGWQHLAGALIPQSGTASTQPGTRPQPSASGDGGDTTTARLQRANAPLYIYCVYDGHYTLSLVGKALQSAYRKLGGPSAFGGSLTQSQVEALARTYAIPAVRLEPHPAPSVVV